MVARNAAWRLKRLAVVLEVLSANLHCLFRGQMDNTPLLRAQSAGHTDCVALLIDSGANIEASATVCTLLLHTKVLLDTKS